jgi:outer membrane protein TolC
MFRSNGKTRPGNRRWHLAILGIVLATLAGCATVGPDYRPPDLSAPAAWNNETGEENGAGTADKWGSTLNDPALSSLIERAVAGNLDLKKARARVHEARAQRGVAQAGSFPTLGATGSATRSRSSEETGTGEPAFFTPPASTPAGNWTSSAVSAAPSRRRMRPCRRRRKAFTTCSSRCWPRWP